MPVKRIVSAGALGLFMVLATAAHGTAQTAAEQDQPDATVRNDSNPTRPVLFSIRPELYMLNDDVRQTALIVRYDRAALRRRRWLPGQRGVVLRLETPISTTHVPGTAQVTGLGDAYAQLLLFPYFSRTFSVAVGSGLLIPTATDRLLGSGKWILAPAAGPVWFFDRSGLVFVKFQNLTSVAGDATRSDVNALLITPTFIHTIGDRWWILADSESRTDWRIGGRTGLKSGVQVGRSVNSTLGIWVKPEVWWGPNRSGRGNLKFGLVWYR
jgi:hypothetical protein